MFMEKKYSYRLVISYKGTNFSGWQRQAKEYQTIQGKIEDTLIKILKTKKIHFFGASRTDAGVHASAQQAVLVLENEVSTSELFEKLNFNLIDEIRISSLESVESFNPSIGVLDKEYHYYFSKTPLSAQNDPFATYLGESINLEMMQSGCLKIIGSHSFEKFSTDKIADKNTVRRIDSCRIEVLNAPFGEGELYVFKIKGKGFLKYMVRNLFSAISAVGRGELELSEFEEIINSKRDFLLKKAPAKGLHLYKINYLND